MTGSNGYSLIEHPNGMQARTDDIDSLCRMFEKVREQQSVLRELELKLRKSLADHSEESSGRTSLAMGFDFKVTVQRPADKWDQKTLRELYQDENNQNFGYIRVSSYSPNLKEIQALERKEDGNESYTTFRERLLAARTKSESVPAIKVEKME